MAIKGYFLESSHRAAIGIQPCVAIRQHRLPALDVMLVGTQHILVGGNWHEKVSSPRFGWRSFTADVGIGGRHGGGATL